MGWTISFICLVSSTNIFVKTAEVESVGPWAKTGVQPSWITSLLKHLQFHKPERLFTNHKISSHGQGCVSKPIVLGLIEGKISFHNSKLFTTVLQSGPERLLHQSKGWPLRLAGLWSANKVSCPGSYTLWWFMRSQLQQMIYSQAKWDTQKKTTQIILRLFPKLNPNKTMNKFAQFNSEMWEHFDAKKDI